MTKEQLEQLRKLMTKAVLARKSLIEVAKALNDADIVNKDTYFGTSCVATYIYEAINKLDFALDQLEIFMKEGT